MEDNQIEELGPYARHPRRTATFAFLFGLGMAMAASRIQKKR